MLDGAKFMEKKPEWVRQRVAGIGKAPRKVSLRRSHLGKILGGDWVLEKPI